jgi:hypothetical protein
MDMSHSLNFLYGALSCLPVPHCKARIGIGSFDRNIGGRLDDESRPWRTTMLNPMQILAFATADETVVDPIVKEVSTKYASEKKITPRDCSKESR